MILRVACVVLLSAGVSYWHVMSNLEVQVKQQLEQYITERGQREGATFQLAADNLTILRDRFLEELATPPPHNLNQRFIQRFFPWSDGTTRIAPQDRSIQRFDTLKQATTFIGRNATLTADLKQQLLIIQQLISAYGPAWHNRFVDTYFNSAENTTTIYWPHTPYGLAARSDSNALDYEYYYAADPQHDPTRQVAWTGVYRDVIAKVWMVSAVLPVYQGDRFLGSVGHDIVLTDLINHTLNNQLPGTYNLIFRTDGRLIAHPQYIHKIQETEGQLQISELGDRHLQRIFQQVQTSQTTLIDNAADREFLAVTQLAGPDWYFVTVYPKSLLAGAALDTAQFVLLSGAMALLVEALLLFSVLRTQITRPLKDLTSASDRLAKGYFAIDLDQDRQDELGQLASSFSSMATQLQISFGQLAQANADLEQRVAERTTDLQRTIAELHRTQSQAIQAEKMSALGQMVAGIAHEINNPVSFIYGNLAYVEQYADQLLNLIDLYQVELRQPSPTLQTQLDEIDLEFLSHDLSKILRSMQVGTDRIREIVLSLRNFSRLDEAEFKAVDLHEGLNNTLLILRHRFEATIDRPAIQIIKEYGEMPAVECYAGQLNQVFMNLLVNAIDAIEKSNQSKAYAEIKNDPNIIRVRTELRDEHRVRITIEDNGTGIPEELRSRIFDPFFTTKPVGQGTGLGLSISYQIITEKHNGSLDCDSVLGKGTRFAIELPVHQSVFKGEFHQKSDRGRAVDVAR